MRRRFINGLTRHFNYSNYLTIEALENNLTVKLSLNTCEYCINGGDWKKLNPLNETESIGKGQILSFRGELTPVSGGGIGTFTISKKCNLRGNCMSMLFGDKAANNYNLSGKDNAFMKLFSDCDNIINVDKNFLPAMTLSKSCYLKMFEDCTNLVNAPELPATTLVYGCYESMFSNCTSLTTAPQLPATTLSDICYQNMFHNCAKLNYIKMLATDTSAIFCLRGWVYNVSSTGTFVKNPAMTTLPTGSSGIPSGWTVVNDGEESGESDKIVNHGVLKLASKNNYKIYWEYPVESRIITAVVGASSHGTIGQDVITTIGKDVSDSSFLLGPGESISHIESVTPTEDGTYIYEVTIE